MKYRLKKDLPFAKAGEEVIIDNEYKENKYVTIYRGDCTSNFPCCDIWDKDFDEWIEEVKPREWYMAITENGSPISMPTIGIPVLFSNDYKIIKVREVIE